MLVYLVSVLFRIHEFLLEGCGRSALPLYLKKRWFQKRFKGHVNFEFHIVISFYILLVLVIWTVEGSQQEQDQFGFEIV